MYATERVADVPLHRDRRRETSDVTHLWFPGDLPYNGLLAPAGHLLGSHASSTIQDLSPEYSLSHLFLDSKRAYEYLKNARHIQADPLGLCEILSVILKYNIYYATEL